MLELAEPFQMSLPAISKHLKLLESANLISRQVRGRVHYLSLSAEPMSEANEWIEAYKRFWNQTLDSFQQYIEAQALKEEEDDNSDK